MNKFREKIYDKRMEIQKDIKDYLYQRFVDFLWDWTGLQ